MREADYRCQPPPRQTMSAGRRTMGCKPAAFSPPFGVPRSSFRSRAEPLAVLDGRDKRLDHLGLDEVTVVLVELAEPEVVAVEVRVRRLVRGAPEIPEVLHQHERLVEL